MATKKKATTPTRKGALTEQLVFRVTKATRERIETKRKAMQLDNVADVLRLTLREAGL